MSKWAIQTRDYTRDFGNGKGLFHLNLDLAAGRVHGFLGPNGAGKTTCIRMLMGFLRPDAGHARVLGMDPQSQAKELRANVGYVPGELALPQMLTGKEVLEHSAMLRDDVDADWREELVDLLGAQPGQKIGKLSKGNKQKIALIDALQHKPKLLIMDEPTDGLDPLLRDRVRQVLRAHVQSGNTVFLSSHVVHEIQTICDDVSILLGGRLRKQANIQSLVAAEGLRVEATVPNPAAAKLKLQQLGGQSFSKQGNRIRLQLRGDPLPALGALHQLGATEPKFVQGDLESLFLHLYAEDFA